MIHGFGPKSTIFFFHLFVRGACGGGFFRDESTSNEKNVIRFDFQLEWIGRRSDSMNVGRSRRVIRTLFTNQEEGTFINFCDHHGANRNRKIKDVNRYQCTKVPRSDVAEV